VTILPFEVEKVNRSKLKSRYPQVPSRRLMGGDNGPDSHVIDERANQVALADISQRKHERANVQDAMQILKARFFALLED
jgi:hypothetical protein